MTNVLRADQGLCAVQKLSVQVLCVITCPHRRLRRVLKGRDKALHAAECSAFSLPEQPSGSPAPVNLPRPHGVGVMLLGRAGKRHPDPGGCTREPWCPGLLAGGWAAWLRSQGSVSGTGCDREERGCVGRAGDLLSGRSRRLLISETQQLAF